MKQKLLPPQSKTIALFPRNLRLITEHSFSEAQTRNIKVALASAFSVFLLGILFLQGVSLWYTLQQRDALAHQRVLLQDEVKYWEGIAVKYQGYRDVYYRIASLQYKLGNLVEAQQYVQKALDLDPNFSEGRVLGAKIGL